MISRTSTADFPTKRQVLEPRIAVALACLCAAAGLFTVYPPVLSLLGIWASDDLKSMGLIVPFVCAGLILRAWRHIGWETDGSWWGFVWLTAAAALVFLQQQMLFIVTVHKDWLLQLPPLPLVAVVYAASMVVLFGGYRLLRAAWFPVVLMWVVIPVPSFFSGRVDLPLQHASAHVARAFAHLLGQQLTEDKLRLMFTPEYGMFIAPGCNGIRGAITLGLAAIVVSYLYRFRWFVFAPIVAGAVLLGYLFNFLRLCLLVVYYRLTLHLPWFQVRAKMADYLIGGTLFVCALVAFFAVANRLRREPEDVAPGTPDAPVQRSVSPRSYMARVAAVLIVSAIFAGDWRHKLRADAANQASTAVVQPLPDHIGSWKLVRTWEDTLITGWVVYTWGEYAPADPAGTHVSLGISPRLGVHDAAVCHIARGEEPTWQGPLSAGKTTFAGAMFNNGRVQKLEASAVCQGSGCSQFTDSSQHVTLVMSRPEGRLPMQDSTGPVPVLLKVESKDTVSPASTVEPQLAAALGAFMREADLLAITRPYSHRK